MCVESDGFHSPQSSALLSLVTYEMTEKMETDLHVTAIKTVAQALRVGRGEGRSLAQLARQH
jgi:hypothetical protein